MAGESMMLTSAYIKGLIDGAWMFGQITDKEKKTFKSLDYEVREQFKHQDNDE